MNQALRAALNTPPTKHKDEPKRPKKAARYVAVKKKT